MRCRARQVHQGRCERRFFISPWSRLSLALHLALSPPTQLVIHHIDMPTFPDGSSVWITDVSDNKYEEYEEYVEADVPLKHKRSVCE